MSALTAKKKEESTVYVCGHCAVGRHQACPRIIANGVNAARANTRCQCSNRQHMSDAAA